MMKKKRSFQGRNKLVLPPGPRPDYVIRSLGLYARKRITNKKRVLEALEYEKELTGKKDVYLSAQAGYLAAWMEPYGRQLPSWFNPMKVDKCFLLGGNIGLIVDIDKTELFRLYAEDAWTVRDGSPGLPPSWSDREQRGWIHYVKKWDQGWSLYQYCKRKYWNYAPRYMEADITSPHYIGVVHFREVIEETFRPIEGKPFWWVESRYGGLSEKTLGRLRGIALMKSRKAAKLAQEVLGLELYFDSMEEYLNWIKSNK